MNNHFNIQKIKFIYLAILYKIVLDFSIYFCIQFTASSILPLTNFEFSNILATFIILIFMVYVIKYVKNEIARLFLKFELLLTVIPVLSYCSMFNQSLVFCAYTLVAFLFQIIILKSTQIENIINRIKIKLKVLNINTIPLILVIVILCVTILFFNAQLGGVELLNFENIYDLRASINFTGYKAYIIAWVSKTLLPFMMVWSYYNKKKYYFIISIFLQILLYFYLGEKYIIFLMLLLMASIFILRKNGSISIYYFIFVLTFLIPSLVYIFATFTGNSEIMDFIGTFNGYTTVRAIIVPAQIKFQYFEFFSIFPKVLFSDGMVGNILNIDYPYVATTGQLIYPLYYGVEVFMQSNSNSGYLGDSFAQLGIFGMVINSIGVGLVVKSFITLSGSWGNNITKIVIIMFCVFLNDGAFLSSLTTAGYLPLLFFTFIQKENEDEV